MQNEKNKLILNITNGFVLLIDELKKEKPEKEFDIHFYEPNLYWSINWKTDKYLKEYFQINLYNDNQKYSLLAEHRVIGIFEHLSDEYFLYKENTLEELSSITDEMFHKTKGAILEAIDKEFDDFDSIF
ncbi:MAG: hypothetical protein ABJH82_13680 [Polaribacter sp.]|uniref:hypothetical protein n=1 Tax=Polaribacter sp. TaxID=1920175 RepID=UPI0032664A18